MKTTKTIATGAATTIAAMAFLPMMATPANAAWCGPDKPLRFNCSSGGSVIPGTPTGGGSKIEAVAETSGTADIQADGVADAAVDNLVETAETVEDALIILDGGDPDAPASGNNSNSDAPGGTNFSLDPNSDAPVAGDNSNSDAPAGIDVDTDSPVETVKITVDGVTRTASTAPTMTAAGVINDWIQRVGMPAEGCEALSTTMVHGVASDWVATWGEWLNDGEGGLACERVLTYTDGSWTPVDIDAAFTVERTKTGALKITDYAPENHRIGSTPAPVVVEKVAKDGGVKINKPTVAKITEAYDKAQEIANQAKDAADKAKGALDKAKDIFSSLR